VENRKIFPPPVYFAPPLKGVTLIIGYRRWELKKTRMMGYTGPTPSGITQLNQFQGESLKGLNTPG